MTEISILGQPLTASQIAEMLAKSEAERRAAFERKAKIAKEFIEKHARSKGERNDK